MCISVTAAVFLVVFLLALGFIGLLYLAARYMKDVR